MSNILKIAGAGVSAAAEETDENFNQTVLLLHGDGTNGAQNNTFLDSSSNGFTITRNPATGPDAPTQGTFSPFSAPNGRWSNYLGTTSERLTTSSSNAAFSFGTGDFTVEGFVNLNAIADCMIFQMSTASTGYNGSTSNTVAAYIGGTNKLEIYAANTSTASTNAVVTSSDIGQWRHFAIVRSSGTTKVYWNGSEVAGLTSVSDTTNYSMTYCVIGTVFNNTYALKGYLSNFRVLKGTALYSGSTITVPTGPLTTIANTEFLIGQSNRFVDNSSNAIGLTVSGSPKVTPFSPFAPTAAYDASVNGGSAYLDGTGDYLTGPTDTAFDVWGGDFTYECWIYPTAALSNNLLFVWGSTSGTYISLGFFNNLNLYSSVSASNPITGTVPTLFAWNHVSVSKESGTFALFLNGVRLGTSTSTSYPTGNIPFVLGASSTGTQPFPGYVAGNRLVKGTAVYDPTSTTLTVPTAPPTAISGTSLLLNFTNAGIFDNTGKNNLETVGNAQIDTTTKKYGTGSMEFDGTGDYLVSASSPTLALGSGDFTIESWVYVTAHTNADGCICLNWTGTWSANNWSLHTDHGSANEKFTFWVNNYNTGSPMLTSTTTVATGTWYHVAVTRSGSSWRLFVNGTQEGSTVTSSVAVDNGISWPIYVSGALAAQALNGFIDDLRITKGVARYTTTFTPPTKAFPDL